MIERGTARPGERRLPGLAGWAASLAVVMAVTLVADPVAGQGAPRQAATRTYIVTLDVADAGRVIGPAGRSARDRIRRRAQRTRTATARLESAFGFRATQRFTHVVPGFAARLTARDAARLRRDGDVASIRPARRYRIAAQIVPSGVRRVRAAPAGEPAVDADIAILDTGIGPIGGNELNVAGGVNCSGDGLGPDAWQDLYPSRHGTHVAGTAAARDNDLGVVGVAPGARLWSVRVFRANGYGDEATIICGLDWVAATHGPAAPPGSQPIEVVNMSLEGPRPQGDPEACAGRPTPDPDPMHLAVCAVHAAGVTMVAAAGNDGIDARFVSPAGYDQVVTVGALSDFDGEGGARASPSCGSTVLASEGDDRWARYSNHGQDVDLLAPGTCVTSTQPGGSGDATARLTGTSMAAPHVSGAAARHLAAHPGTEPERMRRLLRAAGRLDWELRSDPDWAGPGADGAPRRLLDVASLVGPPGLRTWVFPRSLVAAAGVTTRRARVDVQRLGGFDGSVSLVLDGLPAAAGTAAFGPDAELGGLNDLGARLTLALERDGAEGRFELGVEAAGGSVSDRRTLGLRVDRTGPAIGALRVSLRGGRSRLARGRAASVRVRWTIADALGTVGRTGLLRRVGSGGWTEVAAKVGLTRAATTIRPDVRTSLRVASVDDLGNRSRLTLRDVRLSIRDSASSSWLGPAGGWATTSSGGAIGGSLLETRSRTEGLRTEVRGRAVALVAPIGPRRGSLRVRVDAGPWRTVSLRAERSSSRRVVWAATLDPGTHLLEVRAGSGLAAVDALLLLR